MNTFWQGKRVLVTGAGGFIGSGFIVLLAPSSAQDMHLQRRLYRCAASSRRRLEHTKGEVAA